MNKTLTFDDLVYSPGGIKLDPRTKIFVLVAVNLLVFQNKPFQLIIPLALIPSILIIFEKKFKPAFIYSVIYIAAAIISHYVASTPYRGVNILVAMMSGFITKMLPGFITGYYLISTTTISEFIAAMQHMLLPPAVSIPVSVMFRFIPTVKEEAASINDAMKMRGLNFFSVSTFLHPVKTFEYIIVPLIISSVKTGDELSAAALTRGFAADIKRTNICSTGFKIQDILIFSITTVCIIILLYFKTGSL